MADKTKDNDENRPRVFVYGTLKRGKPNNRALTAAVRLGQCYLEGPYQMISLGWFPGVVHTPASTQIRNRIFGEVYQVTDDILHTLDLIEGHPNFYARAKVQTPWKNAWCYFLPPHYLTKNYQPLPEGVWQPSDEERDFMRGIGS